MLVSQNQKGGIKKIQLVKLTIWHKGPNKQSQKQNRYLKIGTSKSSPDTKLKTPPQQQ
jgi:hypothetical protein